MAREQASVGAAQYYGVRVTNEGLPDTVSTYGIVKQLELYMDFAEVNAGLPTDNADDDAGTLVIPANSLIKNAYLEVGVAFTSGGSATLELGVEDTDGSVNDADGLDTLAVAALTARSWHVLDGALVGATTGAVDVQVSIDDAVAVFTAGTGRLVVEYVESTVEL